MEPHILPDRAAYNALSPEEKKILTRQIALQTGADWKGMAAFSLWDQKLDTALYELQGRQFVFIPGGCVTLGWNGFSCPETADSLAFREAMDQDVQEIWGGSSQTEEILNQLTSPLRQAVIPPMLVERKPQPFDDGQPVNLKDLELSESWQKSITDFQTNPRSRQLILDSFQPGNPKLRLTRSKDNSLLAEVIIPSTADELQRRLETEGFTLPGADQWEYLCGGGCRTLFPWGDNLAFCGNRANREQTNFFGLTFDSLQEIIKDSPWPFRGGDGGVIDCYGSLRVLNDFVHSPYFVGWYGQERNEEMDEMLADGLSRDYDCYRRILVLK